MPTSIAPPSLKQLASKTTRLFRVYTLEMERIKKSTLALLKDIENQGSTAKIRALQQRIKKM